jgi:hypothetical protein
MLSLEDANKCLDSFVEDINSLFIDVVVHIKDFKRLEEHFDLKKDSIIEKVEQGDVGIKEEYVHKLCFSESDNIKKCLLGFKIKLMAFIDTSSDPRYIQNRSYNLDAPTCFIGFNNKIFWRNPPKITETKDFDTGNISYRCVCRCSISKYYNETI